MIWLVLIGFIVVITALNAVSDDYKKLRNAVEINTDLLETIQDILNKLITDNEED